MTIIRPTEGLRRSRLSRRAFLGTSAALALAASGCGKSSGGADGPLDVALWGDAKRADVYEQALNLFLKGQEGVQAKLQFADLDPYLERLATSAAAKDLPDVMWMRDTHIGRYGSSGALLDLKDHVGDVIDTGSIGDAAVADGTIDGGVYGLPTHYVGQAVLSDDARLSKIGSSLDDVSTWDDLADLAHEAADPKSRYFGITDPTTGSTHRHLEAWIRQAGEELFNAEGGIGCTAATVEGWFEYWSELRKSKAAPTADAQIESESSGWASDMLTTGKAALRLASTNHLTLIQELTETPIGLGSVPAAADATEDWWFFPPILISAAGNTGSEETAAQMINFFINDVDAGKITKLSQGAPSSAAVRDAILPDLNEQEKAFVEQISREQKLPRRPFPIRPEGAEAFNSSITRFGQEIAYGRLSVSDGVKALMDDATQTLGRS